MELLLLNNAFNLVTTRYNRAVAGDNPVFQDITQNFIHKYAPTHQNFYNRYVNDYNTYYYYSGYYNPYSIWGR